MVTKIPTPEEYKEKVSERNRMLLYNLTALSSSLYSMWFDLHTELKKNNLYLDKSLIKKYKRLGNLTNSMTDCLAHLCPIDKCTDQQQDTHIVWADIYESYLKCLLNIIITMPVNEPNKFMKLFDYMDKLNKNQEHVLPYNKPDWEELMKVLNIEPETTNTNDI